MIGKLRQIAAIWARIKPDPYKPKPYPLPRCPQCGSNQWAIGNKYLHERWFGTGVDLYLTARCAKCRLGAKMVFNRHGSIVNKKGWYFQ